MRPAVWLVFLAIISAFGCLHNEPGTPIPESADEAAPQLLSVVYVADPQARDQLLKGFHGLEERTWRWTERVFSFVLQPPAGLDGNPASLDLNFTVPGVTIEKLGPVTLKASINGKAIGEETYDGPGENLVFHREVPDGVLTDQPALVEFELDRAMPPTEHDGRELAVIAISAGLR